MTFKGDVEDLESHRGPGQGKVVLDEVQRVWREQSMWEKGLPRRQQCSGAGPCQVGGRGDQGRRLSRQAGLGQRLPDFWSQISMNLSVVASTIVGLSPRGNI